MSEHTTHSPDSWGKVFNSAEDARHPHTIKQPNHPDVVVERVEELERQVRLLMAEFIKYNDKTLTDVDVGDIATSTNSNV